MLTIEQNPNKGLLHSVPIASGVYFLRSTTLNVVKIGCSVNLRQRVANIAGGFPDRMELVAVLQVESTDNYELGLTEPMDSERWFHRRFASRRRAYEWFDVTAAEIEEAIEAWKVRPPRRFVPIVPEPVPSVAQKVEAAVAELGGIEAVVKLGKSGFLRRKGVGRQQLNHANYLVSAAGLVW